MKKPQDPRKHGLNEPHSEIIEEHKIKIKKSDSYSIQYGDSAKCSLTEALELWEKEKKKLSFDTRVIDGPNIESKYTEQFLSFKTAYPNPIYSYQVKAYQLEIQEYEAKLTAYNAFIENKKKGIAEDIDKHILRLEHKIANLKASRDNQPIPFPDD